MLLPIELDSLVEIYDQPFVIINQNRHVVLINQAFEKTFGVTRSQIQGTPCYSRTADATRPFPCGHQGENCPFLSVFQGEGTRASTDVYCDAEAREHKVRIQAYPLRTSSGEIYLGELIQRDALRCHTNTNLNQASAPPMVGQSTVFRQALDKLTLAADSGAPVLLQGETGTGKELAAAYIHACSVRRDGPFHTLDCSALTEELFESEVFGHKRGAFTGSVGEKRGLFEMADKGTLFLDEIGELSLPLQAKLLRVLESGEFRRVGGTKTHRADVRIVCATNRQLRDAVWFRSDLYYRVACVTVHLPSLAERRSDIPALAEELLSRIVSSSGRNYVLDASALRRLQDYDYPGNIRELRNIIWVASVNAADGCIRSDHVSAALPTTDNNGLSDPLPALDISPHQRREIVSTTSGQKHPKPRSRKAWEADYLSTVLRRHGGNRRAAAQELGVSERTVYRKLRLLGLS